MGDFIYYCFLVNPIVKNEVFKNECYYKFTRRNMKGYTVAKLVTDTLNYDEVIEDFEPECALFFSIEEDGIILFKNKERIIPENQEEIKKCVLDKIKHIDDESLKYILSDTKLKTKDFMRAVKALYVSNV